MSTRRGYRRCKRCGNNRRASRYVGTRGRICDVCRKTRVAYTGKDARLQATYGITLDEWNALLAHQGGVCGACGQTRAGNRYCVDHDHAVERALIAQGLQPQLAARYSVRGLICRRCNKVLRDVRDSADLLYGLVHYLDLPPAGEFLQRDSV